ncbi:MAG: thioredoxin fold domain-containing protein [Flavobacteriaceae bacterium]|nr:thioredoxin fold domain-containing protein [Flavobacteriaceae bacterium]
MKKYLFIAFIAFIGLSVNAQKKEATIKWMTFEEAVKAQAKKPMKIMLDAYTTWCGPCKLLDKNTFTNPDLIDYVNKNFYAVKFNAEGNDVVKFKGQTLTNPNFDATKTGRNSQHQLSQVLGVSAYPTILFLDEKADVITPVIGYRTAQELELYLKFFKEDSYKKITSQEDFNKYASEFKPSFKLIN